MVFPLKMMVSYGFPMVFPWLSHGAQEVAGAVASGGPGNALAKPKPCLLTQKWLTPRWRHMGESLGAELGAGEWGGPSGKTIGKP